MSLNFSSKQDINGDCIAQLTSKQILFTPTRLLRAFSIASLLPDSTVHLGPLSSATDSTERKSSSMAHVASTTDTFTSAIRPMHSSDSTISLDLWQANRRHCSHDMTSAATAAAYSPKLCPTTTDGCRPASRHILDKQTSKDTSADCEYFSWVSS